MSANSKIEWTDHTFNPWIGCTKKSPGCKNCYAEARDQRFDGGKHWGKGAPRERTSEATWKLPISWDRKQQTLNAQRPTPNIELRRPRVFPSLCDWLDDEVPIEWLADFLALIYSTQNLTWLLLTKSPEICHQRLLHAGLFMAGYRDGQTSDKPTQAAYPNEETAEWVNAWALGGEAPRNIWLGVSVEDQKRADERIPILLQTPARIRFLSCEPLLEPLALKLDSRNDLARWDSTGRERPLHKIDWVIVGGESGPKARPCNIEWIRNVVGQCQSAGMPVFVKQLGGRPIEPIFDARDHPIGHQRVDLSDRKGGDPSEWPEDLRVREFPGVDK